MEYFRVTKLAILTSDLTALPGFVFVDVTFRVPEQCFRCQRSGLPAARQKRRSLNRGGD
jgi:hypothetical protein